MRRFPDFLKAYSAYAEHGSIPAQYNVWAGLTCISAALERKVWLPWSHTYSYFPNIYVLLVGRPHAGKSAALNTAVGLLNDLNRKSNILNIMPSQVTEAKFIELMGQGRSFTHRWTEEKVNEDGTKQLLPREMTVLQNSAFYFASEASASLRNIYGEFIACLTDFYDCPPSWKRATKKDGRPITLTNVCLNLIAGSTFDYLGRLVTDENIEGGFASRVLYVVYDSREVRDLEFQQGLADKEQLALRDEYRTALVEDLVSISKITGPFVTEPAYGDAWKTWYPKFEAYRLSLENEKLQSLLARTQMNIFKVSMLLSAAESDARILTAAHFERARELVEGVNAQIPSIFQEAKAKQGPKGSPGALTAFILAAVNRGNATRESIVSAAVTSGYGVRTVEDTFNALMRDDALSISAVMAGGRTYLKAGSNAHKYL